ncbi:hypothetical protein J1N35_038228 [Gossypium stocksii]|uniref:Aminotransferase-like plant mobile domain-containing protein n=1 Tax=Gossypium stocksii TaxID=47602 RepID=A0A9D3UNF4_9ROSI|nr:hypothetical protein J1N35_038228 [Gossypium stocksii]
MFDLRYHLISASVKCWCSETHTFHLSCGECTFTLEDVALQLGLPINGSAITGITTISEPVALCYRVLGVSPNDAESKFTVPLHVHRLGHTSQSQSLSLRQSLSDRIHILRIALIIRS